MGGGGEPAHVQAGLGDDRAGQVLADAGDLRQPGCCRQHAGRAGPAPAPAPVVPSASTPQAAGIAAVSAPRRPGQIAP